MRIEFHFLSYLKCVEKMVNQLLLNVIVAVMFIIVMRGNQVLIINY